eukprot:14766-Heterococcus_DN1.PRE.3
MSLIATASLQHASAHTASFPSGSAPNTKGTDRFAAVHEEHLQAPYNVVRVLAEKKQAAAAANSATSRAARGSVHQRTVVQFMYCCCPVQRANYTVCLHVLLQQQNSLCTLASYDRTSAM